MIDELAGDGYCRTWNHIDERAIKKFPCPQCGQARVYVGMKKGNSERAFAACHTCGTEEQF